MIDWKAIDTVLLDMDGTLLDLHFDNYFWQEYVPLKYAEKHSISLEQSKTELEPRFSQVQGKLEWYCLDYWGRELDLNIVALKNEIVHLITYRPHADSFLSHLRDSGKQVIMITNAHPDSLSLKLERLSMAQYFNRLISSHEYGYPKESQAFWHALEQDISLDRQKALFIDDNITILDAARTFGIAQLLAIRYPDSQKSAWETGQYEAIEDFRKLMVI